MLRFVLLISLATLSLAQYQYFLTSPLISTGVPIQYTSSWPVQKIIDPVVKTNVELKDVKDNEMCMKMGINCIYPGMMMEKGKTGKPVVVWPAESSFLDRKLLLNAPLLFK